MLCPSAEWAQARGAGGRGERGHRVHVHPAGAGGALGREIAVLVARLGHASGSLASLAFIRLLRLCSGSFGKHTVARGGRLVRGPAETARKEGLEGARKRPKWRGRGAGYAGAELPKAAGSERDRTWLWLFGRTRARRPPSTGCAAGQAGSGHAAGPRGARPSPSRVTPRRSARSGSSTATISIGRTNADGLTDLLHPQHGMASQAKGAQRGGAGRFAASKAVAGGWRRGAYRYKQANYFFRNASTTSSSETPVSVFCTALSSGDRFACARRGERQ